MNDVAALIDDLLMSERVVLEMIMPLDSNLKRFARPKQGAAWQDFDFDRNHFTP